jgi:hypothetical protein
VYRWTADGTGVLFVDVEAGEADEAEEPSAKSLGTGLAILENKLKPWPTN